MDYGLKGLQGGVYDFSEEPLRRIPLPRIDWDDREDKELYNLIVQATCKVLNERKYNQVEEIDKSVGALIEKKMR